MFLILVMVRVIAPKSVGDFAGFDCVRSLVWV